VLIVAAIKQQILEYKHLKPINLSVLYCKRRVSSKARVCLAEESSKRREKKDTDLASMMRVRGKFWFLLLWPCFAAETSMMILFLDIIPAALIPL
jgi:hypothetical protein